MDARAKQTNKHFLASRLAAPQSLVYFYALSSNIFLFPTPHHLKPTIMANKPSGWVTKFGDHLHTTELTNRYHHVSTDLASKHAEFDKVAHHTSEQVKAIKSAAQGVRLAIAMAARENRFENVVNSTEDLNAFIGEEYAEATRINTECMRQSMPSSQTPVRSLIRDSSRSNWKGIRLDEARTGCTPGRFRQAQDHRRPRCQVRYRQSECCV